MKAVRRETARSCAIHGAVMERALQDLEESGCFCKADIIDALNFGTIADAIRWDYLREFIEEEHSVSLLPVCSRFFKTHVTGKDGVRVRTNVEREIVPGKYLAGGNGKKTAGYCVVSTANGKLAIKQLQNIRGLQNGVAQALNQYVDLYRQRSEAVAHLLEANPRLSSPDDGRPA